MLIEHINCDQKIYIPTSLHKSLYPTIFESHLSYGITVWGGVSNSTIKPVFIAQKHCLRVLFGDKINTELLLVPDQLICRS